MARTKTDSVKRDCESGRTLQVVLQIKPNGDCFMDYLDGDIADVELHFTDGDCNCEVAVCERTGQDVDVDLVHYSGEMCASCPSHVFTEYDLVPRYLERDKHQFVVRTYLQSEEKLSELVADLREVSDSVNVLKILRLDGEDLDQHERDVDLSQLTPKQRVTLKHAVESGYYGTDAGPTLEELAGEFDVTKSALCQRLRKAEGKVIKQLFSP